MNRVLASLDVRLRLFLVRDRATRELEEEMRLHRELRVEQLRTAGASEAEARAQARRVFGNATQMEEASRDAWGWAWLDELRQDLRYAARRLRQRPGFSLSVIVVLALGIGATTAMFSAVDAAMLRPLPFDDPAQLVSIAGVHFPIDLSYTFGKPPASTGPSAHDVTFAELAAMNDLFTHVAGYAAGALNLNDIDRPERVRAGVVTADFFNTLGVRFEVGPGFIPAEGRPAGPAVVVLSYALWQREFGGRPMVDQVIRLGGQPFTVVGIAPRGFSFPQASEVWIPLVVPMSPDIEVPLHGAWPHEVVARLAPGVTLARASATLRTRWAAELATGRNSDAQWVKDERADLRTRAIMTPLQRELAGGGRRTLLTLLGATALLLLIACANAASLLLAQTAARQREIAVRAVLGANRTRLIRQLLTESVLLSGAAACLGVILAPAAMRIIAVLLPAPLAGIAAPSIDVRVLLFAALLAFATGVGFGTVPAFNVSRLQPAESIQGTGRWQGGRGARRGRRLLLIVELALTIVLLTGAGLLIRNLTRLMAMDRGVDVQQVATFEMAFPLNRAPRDMNHDTSSAQLGDIWGLGRQRRVLDGILAQLAATPGITHAAAVDDLPLQGNATPMGTMRVYAVGAPTPPEGHELVARDLTISPDYFATMEIRVLRGRPFLHDDDSLAPQVAIVSASAAARYWPGADAVGKQLSAFASGKTPMTVVGVVADVRQRGLGDDTLPQVYFPVAQRQTVPPIVGVAARGTLAPDRMLSAMRAAVHAVAPTQPIYHVRLLDDVMNAAIAVPRTDTLLLSLFAALALVIAIVGVYAVVAYGVTQRYRELGIRLALGANAARLIRAIAAELIWVLGIAIAVGVAGAWAASRLVASLLYGMSIHDPLTFVAVPSLLLLAAIAATLVPARRVLRVNPAEVMRAE